MSKVTVIIPVYKTEKYLRASVMSVINQDYQPIDIILVDDGSPDGSPALCDQLSHEYSNIRTIHKSNAGLSSARNAGLDEIAPDTRFVVFLDSDDRLTPGSIKGMVDIALQEQADIVIPDRYTKVYEETEKEEIAIHFPKSMYCRNAKDFVINVMIGSVRAWRATGGLYSYSTLLDSQARFPHGRISEDIIFNLMLMTKANRIVVYPDTTLLVLKHQGSITATFHSGFEKDIWNIDRQAKLFLQNLKLDTPDNLKLLDGMLARNLVAYLFSLFRDDKYHDYKQKKKYATSIVAAPETRNVLRYQHKTPYFENKKTQLVFAFMYKLFQLRLDSLAYRLMAWW